MISETLKIIGHPNYGMQVNLDDDVPNSTPNLHNSNVLYESNCEMNVDDVRTLPPYSFRFGLPVGRPGPRDEGLPPRGHDSGSSNQSTLDREQWESEKSLVYRQFHNYGRPGTGNSGRRASFDSNTLPSIPDTPPTYSRHYKAISVRPNKKKMLAYQEKNKKFVNLIYVCYL